MKRQRRVVITGLGLVSSLGYQVEVFWDALRAGRSGITKVSSLDTALYHKHFGGEVKEFPADKILTHAELKLYGRGSQFTIFAVQQALADAGFRETGLDELRARIGVVIGTTFGEAQILEQANEQLIKGDGAFDGEEDLLNLGQYAPNSLSVNVAKRFGFEGPNHVVPTACAAGNYAIALGAWLIKAGKADVVVAGGSDPFSKVAFSGFARLGVMADDKCQPFDKHRKGMLVGEGAGIVILEDNDLARARRARVYVEVLGYGLSCDAKHMTIPSMEGMMVAIERSLESAGLTPRDVDYICAHGTGTLMNDRTESLAIKKVFYNHGNAVPVSSIKSMLGHSMGAASAVETIASILAMEHEEIPPTINYEVPDPECDIDCVPNHARPKKLRFVLNNSFAFGGNNACVLLAKK